jgi:hypothetical protein
MGRYALVVHRHLLINTFDLVNVVMEAKRPNSAAVPLLMQ